MKPSPSFCLPQCPQCDFHQHFVFYWQHYLLYSNVEFNMWHLLIHYVCYIVRFFTSGFLPTTYFYISGGRRDGKSYRICQKCYCLSMVTLNLI